jgi:hypothetical protein
VVEYARNVFKVIYNAIVSAMITEFHYSKVPKSVDLVLQTLKVGGEGVVSI